MDFIEISVIALSGIGFIFTLFLCAWVILGHLGEDKEDKDD